MPKSKVAERRMVIEDGRQELESPAQNQKGGRRRSSSLLLAAEQKERWLDGWQAGKRERALGRVVEVWAAWEG